MLREKDQALHALQIQNGQTASPASSMNSLLNDTKTSELTANGGFSSLPKYMHDEVSPSSSRPNGDSAAYGQFAGPSNGQLRTSNGLDGVNDSAYMLNKTTNILPVPHPSTSPSILASGSSPVSVEDFGVDIRTWPPNLPSPDILRHL